MEDYYAHWEWQPLENMPSGCVDVTLRRPDGTKIEMCSCDYWWGRVKGEWFDVSSFRFR